LIPNAGKTMRERGEPLTAISSFNTTVQNGEDTFLLAFYLPEVCNLPLGLRWPTDIGFLEFAASICAALGKNSPPFEAVLQALKTLMEPWFNAAAMDPQLFQNFGTTISSVVRCPFPGHHFGNVALLSTGSRSVFPSSRNAEWLRLAFVVRQDYHHR
jgi:hypothetical protein